MSATGTSHGTSRFATEAKKAATAPSDGVAALGLVGDRCRLDRPHGRRGPPLQKEAHDTGVESAEVGDRLDRARPVLLHEAVGAGEFLEQRRDHLGMPLGQRTRREIERVVAREPLPRGQHTRLDGKFGRREVGIPDRPGIDAPALESGAGLGRREIHGLDVAP
jgi:hypothetical protein